MDVDGVLDAGVDAAVGDRAARDPADYPVGVVERDEPVFGQAASGERRSAGRFGLEGRLGYVKCQGVADFLVSQEWCLTRRTGEARGGQ